MSSQRQIEANRRNAQKSTGPTSVTGKAASSMNALKSGIHAKSLVLPSEKLADLEQLIDDYYQRHNPDSPEARFYLDEVIHCEWLLRRYRTAETQMWQYQAQNAYADEQKYPLGKSATSHSTPFSKLQYRVDATRRAYHRALKALKELKAEAAAARAGRRSADPPVPKPLTPNHFTPNWLRSAISLRDPIRSIRTRPDRPVPTVTCFPPLNTTARCG